MEKYENHNNEYSKEAQNGNEVSNIVTSIAFLCLVLAVASCFIDTKSLKKEFLKKQTNEKTQKQEDIQGKIIPKIEKRNDGETHSGFFSSLFPTDVASNQTFTDESANIASVVKKLEVSSKVTSFDVASKSVILPIVASNSINVEKKSNSLREKLLADTRTGIFFKGDKEKRLQNVVIYDPDIGPKMIKPPLYFDKMSIKVLNFSHLRCKAVFPVPAELDFSSEEQTIDGQNCVCYSLRPCGISNANSKVFAFVKNLPSGDGFELYVSLKDKTLVWTVLKTEEGIKYIDNINKDNYVIKKEDKKYTVIKNGEEFSEVKSDVHNKLVVINKDNKDFPLVYSYKYKDTDADKQLYYSMAVWSFVNMDSGSSCALFLESLKYEMNNDPFDISEKVTSVKDKDIAK